LSESEKFRKRFIRLIRPFGRVLNYQSIARQMFVVEEMPDGAVPFYEEE
jgi:hypothetical protein